ncbi:hypothetical protein ACL03H_22270 [Saccharopolyspora sp. MS10]|uniref:hypothetical protein n=1 Tax=Saccharopolyspora sp. MS10 TaxID=3385973 RepID=UPI00399F90D6
MSGRHGSTTGDPLSPGPANRLGALLRGRRRPRGARALLARRLAAGALLLLAAVLSVLPAAPPEHRVRAAAAPAARSSDPAPVAPPEAGRPTTVAPGAGRVAVPVRLADPAVAELLRPGFRVDLITPPGGTGDGSVLEADVPVLAVRAAGADSEQGRLLLIGVPEQRAAAVAGATLIHSVTVTLR